MGRFRRGILIFTPLMLFTGVVIGIQVYRDYLREKEAQAADSRLLAIASCMAERASSSAKTAMVLSKNDPFGSTAVKAQAEQAGRTLLGLCAPPSDPEWSEGTQLMLVNYMETVDEESRGIAESFSRQRTRERIGGASWALR